MTLTLSAPWMSSPSPTLLAKTFDSPSLPMRTFSRAFAEQDPGPVAASAAVELDPEPVARRPGAWGCRRLRFPSRHRLSRVRRFRLRRLRRSGPAPTGWGRRPPHRDEDPRSMTHSPKMSTALTIGGSPLPREIVPVTCPSNTSSLSKEIPSSPSQAVRLFDRGAERAFPARGQTEFVAGNGIGFVGDAVDFERFGAGEGGHGEGAGERDQRRDAARPHSSPLLPLPARRDSNRPQSDRQGFLSALESLS